MVTGSRSRSSSPEPKSTTYDSGGAPPATFTGSKRSPANCFRAKSKKPALETNGDTVTDSTDISDLPTNSLDNIREKFQTSIEPCNQSASPDYQDRQCDCDETVLNSQKSPASASMSQKTTSPVRTRQEVPPPPYKPVCRNKSPASNFRTKPKKQSPANRDRQLEACTQSACSEAALRQARGTPKRALVQQTPSEDTSEESLSYETPKSIEDMRESLQNVIDNTFCDGTCSESEPYAAPVCRGAQCIVDDSRRASLTTPKHSRGNANPNSYSATPVEGYPRASSRCVCNSSSIPVSNQMESCSAHGGASGVCNSAFQAAPEQNHPAVRGPFSCVCDSAQSPASPTNNSTRDVNDGNLPIAPPPEEECPCDSEDGPDSPCVAKRFSLERFRWMFDRVVRPRNASCQIQSRDPLYVLNHEGKDTTLPKQITFKLCNGIPSGPPPLTPPPRKVMRKEEKVERIVANASKQNSYDRYTNKVDIYYFDHGNSGYYRTTDNPPSLITDEFLEKSDKYATQFWANIFGVCHVGISYVTIFFLQLFRFVCYSFIRSPIVGFIQILADYVVKPILSILFNGIVQTIFIFLFNIATSIRDLCEPLAHSLGFFLREIAHVFRAMRLVEVNTVNTHSLDHPPKAERCKRAPITTRCEPCDVA